MVNRLGEPVRDRSGTVTFQYGYDDLHRLTSASGEAKSRAHTIDRFTASYAYSDIHNMTSNVQIHEVVHGGDGLSVERPPKTNHDFAYTYDPVAPHRATKIGNTFLVYDGNGNTVRECRDTAGDPSCGPGSDHLRRYGWSAENRLEHVIDGGGRNITRFVYDAAGDRVVKLGRGGEAVTIGQFWSLKGRRAATKHVFAGATRLASKLLPPPGWGETSPASVVVSAITVTGLSGTTETVTASSATNENGCDPSNYQPQKCPVLPGGDPSINHQHDDTRVRPETYYYHPDHLGSTSWVTDQHARVHEHVEYFPYGEVWREPRSDADGGPVKGQRFLFTGKELDEETGLYYFGARYYMPSRAVWLNVDPLIVGMLDPPAPKQMAVYGYGALNPIYFVDPDGLANKPARKPYINEAIATDPFLERAIKAAPNFSQRAFENAFESGAIYEMGSGSGATLKGIAGEAIAAKSYSLTSPNVTLQPEWFDKRVPDLRVELPSGTILGIRFWYNLPNVLKSPYGETVTARLSTRNQFAYVQVKAVRNVKDVLEGVAQTVNTAEKLKAMKEPGVAVLLVDEAAWHKLGEERATAFRAVDQAGGYIQLFPGLADKAEGRGWRLIQAAERLEAAAQ